MMTRRLVTSVVVTASLMALSGESHAYDPCAPWGGIPPTNIANNIKVIGASGNMPPNSTALAFGMAEWNSCHGTPNFSGNNGVAPITVKFWDGRNDGTLVGNCGQECGCWAPDGSRTVHVFTRNHNGSRNCMADWKYVIAHELGHAIGLDNATPFCGDCRIMNYTTCQPFVSDADCNIIDPKWFVFDEEGDECDPALVGGDHNFEECPASSNCPNSCSPILLDLAGDGFRFTDTGGGVDFDVMGLGQLVRIAWAEPRNDDVFLVLDRNNSGWIESGLELFGNFTEQPPTPEPNGYEALALFDTEEFRGNRDGRIDRSDKVYRYLLVWRDGNQNGISDASELYTLEEVGVESIYLDYWESDEVDKHGNELRYFGRVCLNAESDTVVSWTETRVPLEEDQWNAASVLDPMGLRDGGVPVAVLATDCEGLVVQSTDVFFANEGESRGDVKE